MRNYRQWWNSRGNHLVGGALYYLKAKYREANTITEGTNILSTPSLLKEDLQKVFAQPSRKELKIEMWDGNTAQRCVESLVEFFQE